MENITTFKHRFLCCNQETYEPLIWRDYGYWCLHNGTKKPCEPPEWFNEECIKKAEDLAKNVKEPNLQVTITTEYKPGESWGSKWTLFDPNNPHIDPDSGAVIGCKTEQAAHAYAMERYTTLKRLYDGDVEALLVYQKTGVACLPDWNTNEIDSWGFKEINGKIVKTRVPRASEVKA
jgi:hypothetical protein